MTMSGFFTLSRFSTLWRTWTVTTGKLFGALTCGLGISGIWGRRMLNGVSPVFSVRVGSLWIACVKKIFLRRVHVVRW